MEFDLFQRLVQANAIDSRQAQNITEYHSGNATDNIILDRDLSSILESGIIAGRLLEYVSRNMNKESGSATALDEDKLSQLKETNSAPAKLFNWNLIMKEIKKLGIQIDEDTLGLIIAGDLDMIIDLLKQICDTSDGNEKVEKRIGRKKKVKEGVDILSMDPNRKLTKCESSLEIILNTL